MRAECVFGGGGGGGWGWARERIGRVGRERCGGVGGGAEVRSCHRGHGLPRLGANP